MSDKNKVNAVTAAPMLNDGEKEQLRAMFRNEDETFAGFVRGIVGRCGLTSENKKGISQLRAELLAVALECNRHEGGSRSAICRAFRACGLESRKMKEKPEGEAESEGDSAKAAQKGALNLAKVPALAFELVSGMFNGLAGGLALDDATLNGVLALVTARCSGTLADAELLAYADIARRGRAADGQSPVPVVIRPDAPLVAAANARRTRKAAATSATK